MQIEKRPVKNCSSRNGLEPLFIVNHIMQGTMDGTESWFNNPKSQASSNYGIGKNGEVREWVAPELKAWANGIVTNPNNWAYAFNNPIAIECPNVNPNNVSISIELEGYSGEILTDEQYRSLLDLHKYLLNKYPKIKRDSDHIIGHYRIDPVNRLNCPGSGFPWSKLFSDLNSSPPIDIYKPHWAEEHFQYLKGLGIDFSERNFDSLMTRGEFFAGLAKYHKYIEGFIHASMK